MIGDAVWLLSSGREMERDVSDHIGADRLWTQPDTSQRSKGNTLASAALWFAQCEMRILFVRAGAASGHPSGRDCGPSPGGPLELRLHSGCLQGGLLIACSSTNWFSARSEPEWQGVKGGISCFCIYNSVASCVYVCVPKECVLGEEMDGYTFINLRMLPNNNIWRRMKSTTFSVYGSAKLGNITHQSPSNSILKREHELE